MFQLSEIEVKTAVKYLKRDLRDDWYRDLQNYSDIYDNIQVLTKKINDKIVRGRGIYVSQKSILFNIPKGNGGFRYSLEFSPLDRIAYHIFGIELISMLDKVLPFNILSHRKNMEKDTLFKPMIEQWNKFTNYTRVNSVGSYIIETDLSNYYNNIDILKLKDLLIHSASRASLSSEEFLRCSYSIESIISILKSTSFDGFQGLPQNMDISSFLANIYMTPLDECLSEQIYFRYMDDIRIIVANRSEANKIMLNVVETLRRYRLAINSSKTKIIEPGTDEHNKFVYDYDFESKKLDVMLNSKKKKYVLESFYEIYNRVITHLEKKTIYEREFRFLNNRLITFLNAIDVVVPKKYKDEIAGKLIGAINVRPDCADQICALAQAVGNNARLHRNLVDWVISPDNQTFEWAVYSIIKILLEQKCASKKLIKFCKMNLNDRNVTDPIKAISAVYLNKRARSSILKLFSKSNSFFLQRHLLIALAYEEPECLRKKKIYMHMLDDFSKSHHNLHRLSKKKDFKFVNPPDQIIHKILIKELVSYD